MNNNIKPFYKHWNFWLSLGNLVVLSFTLLFLIFYTNYTKGILDKTHEANQLSQQPLLDFWAEYETPFKFENKGTGPALNIILLQKSTQEDKISIVMEKYIISALAVGKTAVIPQSSLVNLKKQTVIERIPYATNLIEELSQKENNWLGLIYEDIFKNKFYTIINGVGNNYDEMIQFKKINNPN